MIKDCPSDATVETAHGQTVHKSPAAFPGRGQHSQGGRQKESHHRPAMMQQPQQQRPVRKSSCKSASPVNRIDDPHKFSIGPFLAELLPNHAKGVPQGRQT